MTRTVPHHRNYYVDHDGRTYRVTLYDGRQVLGVWAQVGPRRDGRAINIDSVLGRRLVRLATEQAAAQ